MKVTIKLDKRTCKKNGEFPIKFMVSAGSSTLWLPSGYSVLPKYWNEKTGLLRANAIDSEEINNYLTDQLSTYKRIVRGLDDTMSIDEVKEAILSDYKGHLERKLKDVWGEFVSNKEGKTKSTYNYAWQKVCEFTPNLDWDRLDYAWLLSFQKYLTDSGLGIDSRGIVFRCLRAVNNYALRCEYTTTYPFRSFKIAAAPASARRKNEQTLTVEEIKRLWSAELDGSLAWARDVWFVSFFLGGVNLIDLYNMKSVTGLHLSYVRTKIQRFQPESVELDLSGLPTILTDWILSKGSNGFVVDQMDKDWQRFSDYHKKCLQRLSVAVGLHVNMYAARYTWATLAASSGVAVDVIDRVQGHIGSGTLAEKYYIKFDWSRVRDALGTVARLVVE